MEFAAGFSSLLQDLAESAPPVPLPQRTSPPPRALTPDSVGGETRSGTPQTAGAGTAGSARNSPPLSQMPLAFSQSGVHYLQTTAGDQSGKLLPAPAAADDGPFRVTEASVAIQLRAILESRGSSSEAVSPVQQLRLLLDALDDCTVSFNGHV